MEAEAEKEKDGGAEAITQALVAETDLDPSEEGDKVAALRKSVVGLLDFLDQGGGVDCVIPDTDVEEGEDSDPELTTRLAELRASFQEIRVLDSSFETAWAGRGRRHA